MGVSSALQWWEEWQLRTLVLSSLGVQYFLAIFGGGRKFRIPPWYRFFIWLSFLGSDALAIYALATLFNRQKKLQQHSSDLEVFWAPILLIHLGGQLIITAYNIEDNELWRRHIVTSLSQVTVAIYVFCKSWSWSADKRLLAAAVLLFIPGIIKCFDKPLSLKSSSFNSLASDSDQAQRTTATDTEEELEAYVQKSRTFINNDPPSTTARGKQNMAQLTFPEKLFVDFARPYSYHLTNLRSIWASDDKAAYEELKQGLSNIFDLLYTKIASPGDELTLNEGCSLMTTILAIALPIAVIGLFHSSNKQAYGGNDVIVTFVLLYGTLLLELISVYTIAKSSEEWPGMVAQRSLIGLFAHNQRHTRLMSFARRLQCKDMLAKYWYMESCYSSEDITELVRGQVKDWWKKYITGADSYRMFNDIRGQWTLESEGCGQRLGWSLEKPFDDSVLLWHIAMDTCFQHMGTSPDCKCARRCKEISNYMMHLLFANPEMLMAGSRRNLFTTAYDLLEDILKYEDTVSG